jgi:DNA-binding NarL/FixJ family response regulator
MSTTERQTFLLGPNRLQLDLISSFITQRANIPCLTVADLDAVPYSPDTKHLILYDCKRWKQGERSEFESSSLQNHLEHNLVVLINVDPSQGIESEALNQGVRGFLYQHEGSDTLLKMVHAVFASELWVSRNVMTSYIQGSSKRSSQKNNLPGLTSREVDVLVSIRQGRSNEMIAEELCISPHTVKTHVYRIFKKIKVSSRLQAANWSSQHLST